MSRVGDALAVVCTRAAHVYFVECAPLDPLVCPPTPDDSRGHPDAVAKLGGAVLRARGK